MANHRLVHLRVSVSDGLGRIHNLAHLGNLFFGEINISRCPVLDETVGLGRSWDRDHALRSNPRKSNLRGSAALANSQCLDAVDDGLVLVEVLALELGDWCC